MTEELTSLATQELVARALAIGSDEEDDYWAIVLAIRRRSDRPSFDIARRLCSEPSESARTLGADILGQFGLLDGSPYLEESFTTVVALCDTLQPSTVLESALRALGHLYDARALPTVLSFAGHAETGVRLAVAQSLYAVAGDPPAPDAVAALLALMRDDDPDIRDWATFGLGSQLEVDTPEIRQALFARLDDPEADTAGEALVGLAKRKDLEVVQHLIRRLEDGDVGNLVVEAAEASADPRCLPGLYKLRDEGWDLDDPRGGLLAVAIESCEGASRKPQLS